MGRFTCRGLLAGLALVAGVTAAGAEEIVIIESSAPDVEAGAILDSADVVNVPAGTSIVIVEPDGSTRTIEGPFQAALGAAGEGGDAGGGLIANLGKLVSEREESRQVLGAIRAAPGQVAESVYVVDVGRSGDVCIADGASVRLWRPATMAAETEMTLTDAAAGGSATVLWLEGAQTLDWPSALPPADGARYAVRLDIAPRPAEVRLRFIPDDVVSDAARAAWMADAGCRRQAGQLLAHLTGDGSRQDR